MDVYTYINIHIFIFIYADVIHTTNSNLRCYYYCNIVPSQCMSLYSMRKTLAQVLATVSSFVARDVEASGKNVLFCLILSYVVDDLWMNVFTCLLFLHHAHLYSQCSPIWVIEIEVSDYAKVFAKSKSKVLQIPLSCWKCIMLNLRFFHKAHGFGSSLRRPVFSVLNFSDRCSRL